MYNTRRVMEECLAIKPDLLFLWDEAWFGFAPVQLAVPPAHGHGRAAALAACFADPRSLEAYLGQAEDLGADLDPADPRLLDARLVPDPRDGPHPRLPDRTRPTSRCRRCARARWCSCATRTSSHHEAPFHEAVFTHASTSPNLQIIASLDVARRQMELEGYELVTHAIELAIEIRRDVNTHPLVSKYFRVLEPAEMVPARVPPVGPRELYRRRA